MCGITGIFNFAKKNKVDKRVLKQMTDAIKYRGPDHGDYFIDDYIGLGYRRLAIIDLSKEGNQPIYNEDKSICIVFNGEIYNFHELRTILEQKKHKFSSNTDTETIVHAYEEFGIDCVKYLRGMFAFAVWNSNKQELFIARDRIGKKPLFYYTDSERFVFGSELKCLMQDKAIPKKIDKKSISLYFSYGYVPSPNSVFTGIKKLMPGHTLIIDKKGKMKINEYWDLKYEPEIKSEKEWCGLIKNKVQEAVKLRLISDVPLGAFLSGGIDSSIIVSQMSQLSKSSVKTFSIGFEEEEFSELKYAKLIAEKYKTDHHEFIVKPDAVKILPKLVWLYNEPYSDSSALPSYYVAEMTRKHVTVALNGDGGDESFGGYDRYLLEKYIKNYNKIKLFHPLINRFISILPTPAHNKHIINKIKRFIKTSRLTPEQAYLNFLTTFNFEEKTKLINQPENQEDKNIFFDFFNKNPDQDFISKATYSDIKRYLPEDLLVKMDMATMGNSLEGRSPFLDHELMELAAKIPSNLKINRSVKKYILKKTFAKELPKEILKRKKQGFGAPIIKWFENDLKYLFDELIFSQNCLIKEYADTNFIKKVAEEHGAEQNQHKLWNLLCLETWLRINEFNSWKKPVDDWTNLK